MSDGPLLACVDCGRLTYNVLPVDSKMNEGDMDARRIDLVCVNCGGKFRICPDTMGADHVVLVRLERDGG